MNRTAIIERKIILTGVAGLVCITFQLDAKYDLDCDYIAYEKSSFSSVKFGL